MGLLQRALATGHGAAGLLTRAQALRERAAHPAGGDRHPDPVNESSDLKKNF